MSIIGQNVAEVYTSAELATQGKGFGLGDLYTDATGNQFVYVTAGGSIAAGDVVQFTAAYSATGLTTASSPRGRRVGVAMAAMTSGQFGFVQIFGVCAAANVLASCAADTRLNTTATAGSLDDDGTAGAKQIEGIYLSTARAASAGPAPCTLNQPYVSVTI